MSGTPQYVRDVISALAELTDVRYCEKESIAEVDAERDGLLAKHGCTTTADLVKLDEAQCAILLADIRACLPEAASEYERILNDIETGDEYDKVAKDAFYRRMAKHHDSIDPTERDHLLDELRKRLPGKPSKKTVRSEYDLRRCGSRGKRNPATAAVIEYARGGALFKLDPLLEALRQHGKAKSLFVYAGQLVEPGRHPEHGLRFVPLNHEAFAGRLGTEPAIEFVQTGDDCGKRTTCPAELRKAVFSQTHRLSDIEVQWIATTPIYRNGELYAEPGYYAPMRVWIEAPEGVLLPQVCDKAAAMEALNYLLGLLKEFRFKDDVDRTTALAALLTAAVRGSMRCPAILITKPSNRAGASTLTTLLHIMLAGTDGFQINAAVPTIEVDKIVDTAQLEGHVAMLLDNAITDGGFTSAALAQAITAGYRRVRILGSSKTVSVECRQLIILNGVRVKLTADLAERFIAIRLDPRKERASELKYDRTADQLFTEAKRDRVKMLTAAFTILAAHHRSGERVPVKNIAAFEEWCSTVSASLVWLGLHDVATSQESISLEDPATQTRRALVAAWLTLFGESEVTTLEVANGPKNFGNDPKEPEARAAARETLEEVLNNIALDKYTREISVPRLGNWLGRNTENTVGQHQLIKSGTAHGGGAKWRLVRVDPTAPEPPPPDPPSPDPPSPDPPSASPPETLSPFDDQPAGTHDAPAADAACGTAAGPPVIPPTNGATDGNGHDKTREKQLMAQLNAITEDADRLVQGGFTDPEKVARATEDALLKSGIHPVNVKRLQRAARNWMQAHAKKGGN